jgi:hypothetical protein
MPASQCSRPRAPWRDPLNAPDDDDGYAWNHYGRDTLPDEIHPERVRPRRHAVPRKPPPGGART